MKSIFRKDYVKIPEDVRMDIIERSSKQVSRGVFFSTIIIITSFLPVFLLTGQEGKLFHPLAYTKTFIMIVDAILVITLAPVLISFFMKGRFRRESANPINRGLERIYEPIIRGCIKWRRTTIAANIIALLISIPLLMSLGREFMPPLDEGSLLFMPVTLPDVSNSEVKRILQVQDKIIKSVPEVENVLGKAGRANTATDNSPISMVETIILLKPKSQWRAGLNKNDIINELNSKLQIPGVTNGWTQPIINRINMLSDQQIQLGNVQVDTVGKGVIGNETVLTATLNIDETNSATVSARIAGRIERLYFKNEGDYIQKGARLYDVYSEELNNAKQEYILALEKQATLDNSIIDFKQLVQSAKNKLLLWGMMGQNGSLLSDRFQLHKYCPPPGVMLALVFTVKNIPKIGCMGTKLT